MTRPRASRVIRDETLSFVLNNVWSAFIVLIDLSESLCAIGFSALKSSSNVSENLFFRESCFGRRGILVGRSAITKRGDDRGGKPLFTEAKDLVVLGAIETLHRTGVDAEEGSAGEEIAQGDVGLVARPGVPRRFIHAFNDAADQDIAIRGERFNGNAPCGGSVTDKRVHICFAEIPFCSEYHQMGCVRDLGLPVGGGQQPRPRGGVSHHDEFPWLQPAAGRGQEQCVLECRPVLGVDFACGIELLSGVTPVQPIQELF